MDTHEDNPFAACYLRPTSRPYLGPDENAPRRLLERLRLAGWWGEIVGPHGSGKSTLLASLQPLLQQTGRSVQRFTLHAGGAARVRPTAPWTRETQVIVDGWEQLVAWRRWQVSWRCRRHRAGLLVTTHHRYGFPRLATTTATLQLAHRIVAQLLDNHPAADRITAADVAEQFTRHGGNLREMLFGLYDVFEARRP